MKRTSETAFGERTGDVKRRKIEREVAEAIANLDYFQGPDVNYVTNNYYNVWKASGLDAEHITYWIVYYVNKFLNDINDLPWKTENARVTNKTFALASGDLDLVLFTCKDASIQSGMLDEDLADLAFFFAGCKRIAVDVSIHKSCAYALTIGFEPVLFYLVEMKHKIHWGHVVMTICRHGHSHMARYLMSHKSFNHHEKVLLNFVFCIYAAFYGRLDILETAFSYSTINNWKLGPSSFGFLLLVVASWKKDQNTLDFLLRKLRDASIFKDWFTGDSWEFKVRRFNKDFYAEWTKRANEYASFHNIEKVPEHVDLFEKKTTDEECQIVMEKINCIRVC